MWHWIQHCGWARRTGIVLSLMVVGGAELSADAIFAAREFLYSRVMKQGTDLFPDAFPMAVNAGGIYVGATFLAFQPALGPQPLGVIRRYDTSANEIWTRQIQAAEAFPSRIAATPNSIYVAGSIGFGRTDWFLRKFDEAGNEVWSRQARLSDGGYHVVTGLAADSSGVYLAAWNGFDKGVLRKYSPAGDELWSHTITVLNTGGVALQETSVYVAGWTDAATGFLRKYTTGGDELWTRQVDLGPGCSCVPARGALAAYPSGVYIGGTIVSKVDHSGNTLWKRPFAPAESNFIVTHVALDATGLYVSGGTERAFAGQCKAGNGDVFVRKYDLTGTEQWTRQFGTSGREFPGGVDVDATGVYVSGGIRGGPAHGSLFLTKIPKTQPEISAARPQIWHECVVNAANYAGGGVAPGEIVTMFGQGIGPADLTRLRIGDDGALTTTLSDTRVFFNGVPAPLLYVSDTQSSAIVPHGVAGNSTVVLEVERLGIRSDPLTLPVAASRPGVFTADASGYGQGAILNADLSLNSAANPAERGSIIAIYLTGEGLTNPDISDGRIIDGAPPKPRLPVSVAFEDPTTGDGESAEVLYAGAAPGSVAGLLQVNVRVPVWARSGSAVPFFVQIGAEPAEAGFTVALR